MVNIYRHCLKSSPGLGGFVNTQYCHSFESLVQYPHTGLL